MSSECSAQQDVQCNLMTEYFRNRRMNQRACGKLYQRYQINSFELDMLGMLAIHCQILNKPIVSREIFLKELSGNSRRMFKFVGYMHGLMTLGLVGSYQYVHRPDGVFIGISEKGEKVLNDYWVELKLLTEKRSVKVSQTAIIVRSTHNDHRYKLQVAA